MRKFKPKEFTTTELNQKSKDVLDTVESNGWVILRRRNKPSMVLMLEEAYTASLNEVARQVRKKHGIK